MARVTKNTGKKTPKKKAIQFQMGWGGLTAVVISTICVLLWTFIMGFWVGQKLIGRGESPHKSLTVLNKIGENRAAPQVHIPEREVEPAFPPVTAGEDTQPLRPQKEQMVAEAEKSPLPTEVIGKTPASESTKAEPETPKTEVQGSSTAPEPAPKKEPAPAKKEAKPQPKKAEKPAKKVKEEPPKPKKTYFVLQIASYRDRARAEREAERWRKKGITAQVSRVSLKNKGVWYRVYLGRYKTVQEATAGSKRLARKEGVRSYVVPIKH